MIQWHGDHGEKCCEENELLDAHPQKHLAVPNRASELLRSR